jgi:ATP-dependent protease HslVU (ClpYQ) peptidase subunit
MTPHETDLERIVLELMRDNAGQAVWSARFEVTGTLAVEAIKADLIAAGASGAFAGSFGEVVVEFEPSLVRQIASVAVKHAAVLDQRFSRLPPGE